MSLAGFRQGGKKPIGRLTGASSFAGDVMAESKDLWLCVNQLAKALEAKGSTIDSQIAAASDEFRNLPRDVQEQVLKRLAEVAVASASLVSAATSHLALSKSKQPNDL
jgi:hypothetical protein